MFGLIVALLVGVAAGWILRIKFGEKADQVVKTINQ